MTWPVIVGTTPVFLPGLPEPDQGRVIRDLINFGVYAYENTPEGPRYVDVTKTRVVRSGPSYDDFVESEGPLPIDYRTVRVGLRAGKTVRYRFGLDGGVYWDGHALHNTWTPARRARTALGSGVVK